MGRFVSSRGSWAAEWEAWWCGDNEGVKTKAGLHGGDKGTEAINTFKDYILRT